MPDILKEVIKVLPEGKISDAAFEAANIVLYTKDKKYFLDNKGTIKEAVQQFKKRIELRPDPSLCMEREKAEKEIKKIISEEAGIQELIFDPPRSQVIIHAEKPGVVIGKQGDLLKEIKEKTFWVPFIKRIPPIRSKLIESIRSVLYENAEYRKKFLDKTGHRIYDGWLREKKHEWIRLSFLGAARQVGRTCLFLQTPESRILMDCGIDPSEEGPEAYPYLDAPELNISELDAVIITHSHLDHSGLVPYLFKYGYTGPIYCTLPTRDTMALLQLDMVKIQRSEGKDPIYTSEEVRNMVLHTICLEYEEVSDITPDIRLTFYNSGHILGGAIVHLNIGNGLHNLVFTGDLKYGRTNVLEAANTQFPRVETLVMESTYGGKDNNLNEQEAEEYMINVVKKTFERGGKVLMPVLGSGRAQEVMIIVERLMREKKIPDAPIYLDGMLWDITAIHTAYPEFLNRNIRQQIFHKEDNPFLSKVFKLVGSQKERKQLILEEGPCLILATSGMLQGGPSVEYLKGLAEGKKHSLVFSCYQPPGSLGYRIRSGETELMMRGDEGKSHLLKINLEVHKLEITNHSDRKQLMNYVRRCNPQPRKVILMHGESSRCLDLASSIHQQYRIETAAPKNLEVIRIK
ncbi:MAG TPA: beta-CASP ribonuclease aCPSF1 [Candidatus Nanoarchaeia archaeon]|nr:beta-CASP ribonuclease aCPSF1 [Candidatus Nanoarchaeia archaeon]